MERCYICLEECQATSPCDCEMTVHEECLANMYQKMSRNDCSICRSPIRVEYVDLRPKTQPLLVQDTTRHNCTHCAMLLYTIMAYLVFGWVGKIILLVFGVSVEPFSFWTGEHLLCFLGVFVVIACISNIIIFTKR